MNAEVDISASSPVDIVLSVDEQDGRWLGGLLGLVDSLALSWRPKRALPVTIVHRGALPENVRVLLDGTTRLRCRYLSLEDDIGIVADNDAIVPIWRRLLGLAYADHSDSPFYMLVDSHAFCIRRFDHSTLLPDGLARTQWENFEMHPVPLQIARSLLGSVPLLTIGLSVHPAIYSVALASAAMDLLRRRHGLPAIDLLISLSEQQIEWTDNMIYTLANWARLAEFHLPQAPDGGYGEDCGLHSDIDLWSDDVDPAWSPKRWTSLTRHGLFLSTHASTEVRSILLDRVYPVLCRVAR